MSDAQSLVLVAFQKLLHVAELVEREAKLLHHFGDQLLGLRQVIHVLDVLVSNPLESVEFVVARSYLVASERAPTALGRITFTALDAAVRIASKARLER